MDFAAASISLSQSKLQANAGILILEKAMDVANQGGQLVDQVISEVDILTGDESHLGNNVDKYV